MKHNFLLSFSTYSIAMLPAVDSSLCAIDMQRDEGTSGQGYTGHAGEKISDTPKLASAPQIEGVRSDICISKNYFKAATYLKFLKTCKPTECIWICYLPRFQIFLIMNGRADLRANEFKILMYHFFFHPRAGVDLRGKRLERRSPHLTNQLLTNRFMRSLHYLSFTWEGNFFNHGRREASANLWGILTPTALCWSGRTANLEYLQRAYRSIRGRWTI